MRVFFVHDVHEGGEGVVSPPDQDVQELLVAAFPRLPLDQDPVLHGDLDDAIVDELGDDQLGVQLLHQELVVPLDGGLVVSLHAAADQWSYLKHTHICIRNTEF